MIYIYIYLLSAIKVLNIQASYTCMCYSRLRMSCKLYRVATAQGKQGIWLLTFPDRENREFSKFIFLHRKNGANIGKILNFWKILLLKWQQGDGAFLS